ncbi:hypothetical protein C8R44DRAFT_257645 [Mycena epipterygia]|nr:hypothetical protein C8R44DRAFT_257645 [Mycena epipterygia]
MLLLPTSTMSARDAETKNEPILTSSTLQTQTQLSAGAFFPNSHNFVVSGGNFTSIHNHPVISSGPSDFRTIPLGDLDLQNEIDGSGTISRRRGSNGRTMYSVRIWQGPPRTSAVIYTGHEAEQNWERDVAVYSGIRHPNFLQVYGLVNACGIRGVVFHDDLMSLAELFSCYAASPITTTYLHWYIYREFWVRHTCQLANTPMNTP